VLCVFSWFSISENSTHSKELAQEVRSVRICEFSQRRLEYSDDVGFLGEPCAIDLEEHISSQNGEQGRASLPFWKVDPIVHVYCCKGQRSGCGVSSQHNSETDDCSLDAESLAGLEGDRGGPEGGPYNLIELPDEHLEGSWENLILHPSIKSYLLDYICSGSLFSKRGVDSQLVAWNRLALLYGPPGSGKSTLARSLANKLAVRLDLRSAKLLEIHSNSLFSKWFSESSRIVAALFDRIRMIAQTCDLLVVVIDEVESLSASRAAGAAGAEPSDALRVVNTLLTALDTLRLLPNVLVVATSNLTGQIDTAFLDRADIAQYIGLPSLDARREILRSGVNELIRRGIVKSSLPSEGADGEANASGNRAPGMLQRGACATAFDIFHANSVPETPPRRACDLLLAEAARASAGLSGRTLRKLCLLAHAGFVRNADGAVPLPVFLRALRRSALLETGVRRTVARAGVSAGAKPAPTEAPAPAGQVPTDVSRGQESCEVNVGSRAWSNDGAAQGGRSAC
jgi:pachytene checkpoint protein 2